MRIPLLITLAALLLGSSSAEARHFRQTYGSIVPAGACGEGCTRNANQDFFVPRHCDSCRYGLFSPCKKSCTVSPACWWSHPLYPGYCNVLGPYYYHRRDHVYRCHCGCDPVKSKYGPFHKCCAWRLGHPCWHGCHHRHGCRQQHGCQSGCGCYAGYGMYPLVLRPGIALPNVEAPDFEILGSLPAPGDELLASFDVDVNDVDQEELPGVLLPSVPPVDPVEHTLPSLGRPAPEQLP